jgi:hypothetical protein
MKVYFTYSNNLPIEHVEKLKEIIIREGGTLLVRKRPGSYDYVSKEEARSMVRENQKLIQKADIVITEFSFLSHSTSYHTTYAIEQKKPVLLLYNNVDYTESPNFAFRIPSTFVGLDAGNLLIKEYSNQTIETTLKYGIHDAVALMMTKFNLIISPEINRFLEWSVKDTGLPKSELTRKSLENTSRENKRYQDYLKENELV